MVMPEFYYPMVVALIFIVAFLSIFSGLFKSNKNENQDEVSNSPFFSRISSGWDIIKYSFTILFRYPVFLFPILVVWIIYGTLFVYFKYFFNWQDLSHGMIFLVVYLILFVFAFIFSMSSLVLLELVEQIEKEKKYNLLKAFHDAVMKDLPKAFPVIVIWSMIWFILTIISAIFSKNKNRDGETLSVKDIAKDFSGISSLSSMDLLVGILKKGVRMIVFLIFPAMAWENLSTQKAVKKGLLVVKNNLIEFAAGYSLTETVAMIIFIFPGLLFYADTKVDMQFPDVVWVIVIIYCIIGWSFYLYLEQMFSALLYLWHKKWEKEAELAISKGDPIPKLRDVRQPCLLDDVADLM